MPSELVLKGGGGERGRGGGRGDGAEEGPGGRPPPTAAACSQVTYYKYLFTGLLLVPLVIFCNGH